MDRAVAALVALGGQVNAIPWPLISAQLKSEILRSLDRFE